MPSFHVRHDFTPVCGREAVLLLDQAPALGNNDLLSRAKKYGLELGHRRSTDKVVASLRDLGLVTPAQRGSTSTVELSALGREIAQLANRDPLLFTELIHLRYWWLWSLDGTGAYFSWAYRIATNLMWEDAPTSVSVDSMVATVIATADEEFGLAGMSFSASSILGILHWLRALSPPCIQDSIFQRRPACSPESVVVSLEALLAARGNPRTAPLRLDQSTREVLCRSTLLEDGALDEVLDQASETIGLTRWAGDGGDLVLLGDAIIPGFVKRDRIP